MKLTGLLVVAGLLLAPTVASAAPADRGGGCTTTTSLGRVAGTANAALCVYSGIPYAAAPVGDLRFKPPQPVQPWPGTFQANDNTKVCPQFRDRMTEEYPDDKDIYTDEDCLRLNVWAPRTPGRHPVVVFDHGGAARFGTGNEPRYNGTNLAKTGDAVVVTVNYRLGLLGWGEFGGLDPAYQGSGNNGVRDQIAAYEWVQAHIADFGGDPRNVTAVGESEGAFSLSAMLATDNPQRLFHRVVLQSGTGYMTHSPELQQSFASRLKGLTVDQLRAMSPRNLLDLQEKLIGESSIGGAIYFGPAIDGQLIKRPVIDAVEAGNARGIDLLVGSNKDEIRYFAQFDPSILQMGQQQYAAFFPKPLFPQRDKMIASYKADRPGESDSDITLAMMNDQTFRVPATRLAAAQNKWAKAYVYQFNWAAPGGLGAIHASELGFVFGTMSFTGVPAGAEAYKANPWPLRWLSANMQSAWTSFARYGDPGWSRYQESSRVTRIWDTWSRTVRAPHEAERALWDGYRFPALSLNI
ncbi:carboxylesterase/lipase family protein [Actinocrispum wychmicini]|uniref:Para-nitrobenzyl esterase n=1 Tax=Actinocrispum wychmicini TaxID=1213861 RepID=A0A4R2K422_9PSEU|nr:carboxylesterase family protein [Actinocrispum wychmicini]TCO64556.1 para-nitrobenzyl esterase [Actinocrispum wychmicini]